VNTDVSRNIDELDV